MVMLVTGAVAQTLWGQPARSLPVRLRPIGGETLISYTFRLAAANHLTQPATVLRALGEPRNPGRLSQAVLLEGDVVLNEGAVRRLEAITAIPVAALHRALPALHRTWTGGLRTDIPAWRLDPRPGLRGPCDQCRSRRRDLGPVVVHPAVFPLICVRHRRWIDTDSEQQVQVDLAGVPEILGAHRRYSRLRARSGNSDWAREQLGHAVAIARTWATGSSRTSPRLHARWAARAAALHGACPAETGARDGAPTDVRDDARGLDEGGLGRPSRVLVFPEAVAIAELLCDLAWRRHVAMVKDDLHLDWFRRRVALRLGEPAGAGEARLAHRRRGSPDPLQPWIDAHRTLHALTRSRFWQRVRGGQSPTIEVPFPDVEQFR